MEEYIEIGQIVNSYGIKGFVKVVPYTDNPERFQEFKTIFVNYRNELLEFEIDEVKINKSVVLLKFKGMNDINQIEIYKNCYLKIKKEDLKELPDDTYFIFDLIGMEVFTDKGDFLGNISDVIQTGSNDVYIVKGKDGKEILLPAIADVVKNVDIENKKMTVELLKGLI